MENEKELIEKVLKIIELLSQESKLEIVSRLSWWGDSTPPQESPSEWLNPAPSADVDMLAQKEEEEKKAVESMSGAF